MALIVLGFLCLLSVCLRRGGFRQLRTLRLRWLWLAPLALIVQTVLAVAPGGSHALHAAAYGLTYVPLLAFLIVNRRVLGVPVITFGTLMNGLVILVNGGVMPAAATAERLAGIRLGRGFHNSAVLGHPRLLWFGDIIPVPGPLPNVLSIGDCVIYAGLLVLLHHTHRTAVMNPAAAGPAAVSASRSTAELARGRLKKGGPCEQASVVHP